MEGYIEGTESEEKTFYPIIGGDNPKNEYLEALAKDPNALKTSFEGGAQNIVKAAKAEAAPEKAPESVLDEVVEVQGAEDVPENVNAELDKFLADIDI